MINPRIRIVPLKELVFDEAIKDIEDKGGHIIDIKINEHSIIIIYENL